jgi:FtsP/CotA-like multicopper oxidase with cupredoxin domain
MFLLAVAQAQAPRTHTYYIAADPVKWNYAPHGRNLAGLPQVQGSEEPAPSDVTYRKVIFREYTDATFSQLKPRAAEWEHLGILGPLIRAEVGDTVVIHFKNNSYNMATLHPHGLTYDKASEGALYLDGTEGNDKKDDAVPYGGTHTYTWGVPESAGPGPMDGSSVLWMYHSHFVEPADMNTGLIGPIIVTARGKSKPDGSPKDVDREFVTAFAVFDETLSWQFGANLAEGKRLVKGDINFLDPIVHHLYSFFTINGLIEANLPILQMKQGERVRWYLFANSNEEDVHSAHWHNQSGLYMHMRVDTVSLIPMGMAVVDMVPDRVGRWLYHCHVNDHLNAGMNALFEVLPKDPAKPSAPTPLPKKSAHKH